MGDKLEFGVGVGPHKGSADLSKEDQESYRKNVEKGGVKESQKEEYKKSILEEIKNTQVQKLYEPNMDLLNDAVHDKMSLLDLADKYYDSPENIISRVRQDLQLLSWKEGKTIDSRYLTSLEVIRKHSEELLNLVEMYSISVEFESLPIHKKYKEYFMGLDLESQQNAINELSKISQRQRREKNKKFS